MLPGSYDFSADTFASSNGNDASGTVVLPENNGGGSDTKSGGYNSILQLGSPLVSNKKLSHLGHLKETSHLRNDSCQEQEEST